MDQGIDAAERWLKPFLAPYVDEAYRVVRIQHGVAAFPTHPTSSHSHSHSSSSSSSSSFSSSSIWDASVLVDGEPLGGGKGYTKRAARNEAAKVGLKNLGIFVWYAIFFFRSER
jgi:ribonuclease III